MWPKACSSKQPLPRSHELTQALVCPHPTSALVEIGRGLYRLNHGEAVRHWRARYIKLCRTELASALVCVASLASQGKLRGEVWFGVELRQHHMGHQTRNRQGRAAGSWNYLSFSGWSLHVIFGAKLVEACLCVRVAADGAPSSSQHFCSSPNIT